MFRMYCIDVSMLAVDCKLLASLLSRFTLLALSAILALCLSWETALA